MPFSVIFSGVQKIDGSNSTRAFRTPSISQSNVSAARAMFGPMVHPGEVTHIVTVMSPSSTCQPSTRPISIMLSGAFAAMLHGSQT